MTCLVYSSTVSTTSQLLVMNAKSFEASSRERGCVREKQYIYILLFACFEAKGKKYSTFSPDTILARCSSGQHLNPSIGRLHCPSPSIAEDLIQYYLYILMPS